MNMYAADPCFEKLLSDNRDRYIQQSSNTRCGQVAVLPKRTTAIDWSDIEWASRAEMGVWFGEPDEEE